MIDLKELKQRESEIQQNIINRHMQLDVASVIALQESRAALIAETDTLRKQRNEIARRMKGKLPDGERSLLIEEGRQLKESIAARESRLQEIEQTFRAEAARIPNYAHPDAPVGKEEKDNLEIRRYGAVPDFGYPPRDHLQLGASLDLFDFDTAAKVSGSKFYYLRNRAVLLDLALQRYVLDILQEHGFTLTITPDIAKESIVEGIGFNPRGAESNIYTIQDTGTCLVGTAEITLGGYYADEILSADQLPIKLAGLSHCFRREAGAAGQYSRGLYRVHQFTKVEMFVFSHPEASEAIHDSLLAIEEQIFRGLEIPYRIVDTCTGDLGAPAYRKFDIEAWMPGRGESGEWGEVTSTSNCTDYQARRLNIRFRGSGESGEQRGRKSPLEFVHMLNGTAIAISRALIALLENHQNSDGSVSIPSMLQPYTGFDRIEKPV